MNVASSSNDIDLKMVEFYNLDSAYYQETEGLEKRDYFKQDSFDQEQSEDTKATSTSDLAKNAHDLLSLKIEVEKAEKEEIKRDISNINPSDSFDETIFKIFEQLKDYNNRLSDFSKN